jgi:saccharopine dehydrogenase-like NADP-dependent oxidoreductase
LRIFKNAGRGADVIINLTLIQFNANVMQAAVENVAHYMDTAIGDPVWTQLMKGQHDGLYGLAYEVSGNDFKEGIYLIIR